MDPTHMPVSLSSEKCVMQKLSDLFKTAYQVSSRARSKAQIWEHLPTIHSQADMGQEACVAGHACALPVTCTLPFLNCYLSENCTP